MLAAALVLLVLGVLGIVLGVFVHVAGWLLIAGIVVAVVALVLVAVDRAGGRRP